MRKHIKKNTAPPSDAASGPINQNGSIKIPDSGFVICILVIAFALRAIHLFTINGSAPFTILSLDDSYYDAWALQISKGDILGKEVFYGLPLYPYFLGFVYFIFGHSILIARLAQALFDSITCALLYTLGKNVFNRTTGVIASFILIFYSMSFYLSGFLTSSSLSTFLNLALLSILLSVYKKPSVIKWVWVGLLAGLTSLGNASVLLFVPCIIVWAFMAFKDSARIKVALRMSAMVVALLSVISITAVRNYVVGRDFVPVTYHSGITFYAGNNPDSIGAFYLPQNLRGDVLKTKAISRAIAEKTLGRALKPSEVSKFWFDKAFDFIRSSPVSYAKLIVKKIYFFWWVREIPEEVPLSAVKKYSPILRLPLFGFALISPLSIVGLALSYRRKRPDIQLLYFFVGSALLSTALYFVNSRYRIISEPILILFASALLVWYYQKVRAHKYLYAGLALIASVVLFFILDINLAGYRKEVEYNKLGISYASQGRAAQAEEAFKKAIAINPANPLSHYNLGTFYLSQKKYAEAIAKFKEAIRLNPEYTDAHNNIGTVYNIIGQRKLAIDHFEKSLKANPYQENIRRAYEDLKNK